MKERWPRLLEDPPLRLVGQNVKYDYKVMRRWGVRPANAALRHDGRGVDPGQRRGHLRPRPPGGDAPGLPHHAVRGARRQGPDPGRSFPSSRSPTTRARTPTSPSASHGLLSPRAGGRGARRRSPRHRDAAARGARGDGAHRASASSPPSSPPTAGRWSRRSRRSEAGDLRALRQDVQHQLHEAAPGDPLHLAQAHPGAEDQDGVLHRRGRAGDPGRAGPGAGEDPRAPQALQAEVHLRGRAARSW